MFFGAIASGQRNSQIYLLSLKNFREKIVKEISDGDSVKEHRCYSKIAKYIALKKKYLHKFDSMDLVIKEKNNCGSGYFYYIQITNIVRYDWEDCANRIIKDKEGKVILVEEYDTFGDNIVDSGFGTGKEDKFRVHLQGTSGQTYYREDLR